METTNITQTFPSSTAAIIGQILNIVIFILFVSFIFYIVRLLKRMANAQEESARHLAEIARTIKTKENLGG
jgi:uncharacterized membrane protein